MSETSTDDLEFESSNVSNNNDPIDNVNTNVDDGIENGGDIEFGNDDDIHNDDDISMMDEDQDGYQHQHHNLPDLGHFQPMARNDSLKILSNKQDGPASFTIADSIRLINRRDSNRSLLNLALQKGSPWKMTSTPMVSSPHLMVFPDLEQRRKDQVMEYKRKLRIQKLETKQRERALSLEKVQLLSEENEDAQRISYIPPMNTNVNLKMSEEKIVIQDEDEQWDRKRMLKLKKTMEASKGKKSSSSSSFPSVNSMASCLSIGGQSTTSKSDKYSPTNDMLNDLRREFAKSSNPPTVSIIYGLVNAIIVLPVIMSFGNIIYHDAFFRPYLPVLVKLTVVSGVVHQICFSACSTLPFAVGSVQDAGLIFLSTIASSIVKYCQDRGHSDEEILATTLVGLSLFTATLGVSLVLIGKLRLASYVQMLPTPVVGGYLAFIGFFCGQSALCLLSRIEVTGIWEWNKFFADDPILHHKALMLMAPGFFGGIFIYVAVRKLKHMAVLPLSIAILVLGFYGVLYWTGSSLEDAKNVGWMSRAEQPPVWYHSWDYIKFDKVIWAALPSQILTAVQMIFVVALSSSLDIAAIDLEVSKPLAYNYELTMIGVSNFVSGITGGYTGSYIFSQSIFSLRAGIRSRLAGFVTAFIQAVTVIMPISILSFVPNFIFASLLIMICVDLMIEWLWDVRKKLSNAQYSVALMTFAFINWLGVANGILTGIGYHLLLSILGFHVGEESKNDGDTLGEKSPILSEQDKSVSYKSTSSPSAHDFEIGLNI